MFPISIWQMILVAYCIGPVGRQAHASSKGLTAQSISVHWSGLRHQQRNGIFHAVSVPEGTHQNLSTRKYPEGLSIFVLKKLNHQRLWKSIEYH